MKRGDDDPSATTAPATAMDFHIKSLGFSGAGESPIEMDDSSGTYGAIDGSATQWEDGTVLGSVNFQGVLNVSEEARAAVRAWMGL